MIYDFIIQSDSNEPLYRKIYLGIRSAITNGKLKKGEKLPSIRKISRDLNVSKTTVEAAYNQLCAEGYIKSIPQSGFRVDAEFGNISEKNSDTDKRTAIKKKVYEYDFGSKSADLGNFTSWRKYVKDVLNKPYLLSSYGDVNGEPALREALQRYAFAVRGVHTDSESIIIGAGTQYLLYLLCGRLKDKKTIALESDSYPYAEQIFEDMGFKVIYAQSDEFGIIPRSLEISKPDIVLVNPNQTYKSGNIMPVQRRIDIINYAKENKAVIIEDDYNGELRYKSRPVPAIQSYDKAHVVYLGSFSKILLPSVRISYMAVPKSLKESFNLLGNKYNQSASKLEQLALAAYISEGKLELNLRRLRKIYAEKSNIMFNSIRQSFGVRTDVTLKESALKFALKVPYYKSDEVYAILQKNGINTVKSESEQYNLILSFSGIEVDKIESGIEKICTLLKLNN